MPYGAPSTRLQVDARISGLRGDALSLPLQDLDYPRRPLLVGNTHQVVEEVVVGREVYMAELRNQAENLKWLISSVESDLAQKHESRTMAATTEAWLMIPRKNLDEVEGNTQKAFEARRELAKVLVERITIGRNHDGKIKVELTYRFGPPEVRLGEVSADGIQNSVRLGKAHPGRQTRSS